MSGLPENLNTRRDPRHPHGPTHIADILPAVLDELIADWPKWTELVGPFSAELEAAIEASEGQEEAA